MLIAAWGMAVTARAGGMEEAAPRLFDRLAMRASPSQPAAVGDPARYRRSLEYVRGQAAGLSGLWPRRESWLLPDPLAGGAGLNVGWMGHDFPQAGAAAEAPWAALDLRGPRYDFRSFNIAGGTLKVRMASGLRLEYQPADTDATVSVTTSARRVRLNFSLRW